MTPKCSVLPLGIIAQCGVSSLAPDIPIQNHGCVQLCSSSWAALNNQRGVSFFFVSTGLGPTVERRSGYKLSYSTKVWPGPGFMFGHISSSQGEISSCLDAESAETLGISKVFLFSFPFEPWNRLKFFLQLWPVVHMASQLRSLTGDCQLYWEFSVILTIGPESRELTPIMLISCEILEGLTTKGPSYQSATHRVKAAKGGEECNENI